MYCMDFIIGHLLGDYLFQNDWMAMNKKKSSLLGWTTCFIHSFIYTVWVMACTGWTGNWCALAVFMSHFPIDKTYVVARYMKWFGCFKRIIEDPNVDFHHKTWAYLFVDNTIHLTLLWLIARYVA